MTDIHPDDIAAARQANPYLGLTEKQARAILAAVLPAHDQRIRAQVFDEAAEWFRRWYATGNGDNDG